jgi:hypothetical protein
MRLSECRITTIQKGLVRALSIDSMELVQYVLAAAFAIQDICALLNLHGIGPIQ